MGSQNHVCVCVCYTAYINPPSRSLVQSWLRLILQERSPQPVCWWVVSYCCVFFLTHNYCCYYCEYCLLSSVYILRKPPPRCLAVIHRWGMVWLVCNTAGIQIKSTNVLMPQWSCRGLVHTECITMHTWLLAATHMHASNSSIQCSQAVGLCTQAEQWACRLCTQYRRLSNTMSTYTIWACARARLRHHNP